jgi:hypothetical protein
MTPEDAVSEYCRVIAEYDARYGEDPLKKRQRQREAERQERRQQEVRKIEQQAVNRAAWDEWFEAKFTAALLNQGGYARSVLLDAIGETQGMLRKELRKEFETKFAAQETRIKELEQHQSLEAKFFEMERRIDARQLARDEAKRESQMIPQGELLAKFEGLLRRVDELKSVADLDPRFRELTERVSELEKTNTLDARFAELAREVKGRSENEQGELLEKIETLKRQVDELESFPDLDLRLRELAGRVGVLEQTSSLETRFAELAHEVKRRADIPQGELQEKNEKLQQRQLDDHKRIADLDARFRELAERAAELQKTNDARFTKLTEAKGGLEIQQRELHARTEGLQNQIDDFKRISGQPGPQGQAGPPGKLPRVKEYAAGLVHYEADVVVHAGALWQAVGDTVHAPSHSDWICIARAGRDGSDGRSPNVCGTYNAREMYQRLDIVALDGAAFIARRDNPGICPGDGWQLLSKQGRLGRPGENGERGVRGEKGERGEPGATVVSWQLDRRRYRVSPLMSDGRVGPALELRALFEQYHAEAGQ